MWYNPIVTWLLRSPLHALMSGNTLLLTYTGRRSGQQYTVPISYARDGHALSIITGRRKSWWKNIAGGTPVTVRVRGQELSGLAEIAAVAPEARLTEMLKVYRGMPRALAEKQLSEVVLVRIQLAPAL